MDSSILMNKFVRLLDLKLCQSSQTRWHILTKKGRCSMVRSFSVSFYRSKTSDIEWQQRTNFWPADKTEEFNKYPMITADQLRGRKTRPRRVKMLMRDFIEDSLYNPSYGYFSKHAVIFTPEKPFNFNSLKDEPEFHRLLGQQYTNFEDRLDLKDPNESRQLWHTPTELFKPYYGEAIARYLVNNYKLTQYPYHDLTIYEMGAGNGTLMLNILDHIRDIEPSVYSRTKYKIIEISENLAKLQYKQLSSNANARGHFKKVEIINRSIFEWNQTVSSPCFFLAMEVFDNFAHDCIRYDPTTEKPLQCIVLIDTRGEFYELYSPAIDPVAARFLRVRNESTGGRYPRSLPPKFIRRIMSFLPFTPNLSNPEYIPTRLMQFFDILGKYFPSHKIVTSDFHILPDTVKGINAPVVQTRYQRRVVPVSTPLVNQGYFDILFPTNFNVIVPMYMAFTKKLARTVSHEEFLRKWAIIEETETKSGENPLLSWYKNATVLTTV
ncbi:Protein arginine methyltransferase NDUFAF7-like protein, mitochondrial [Golovinomyces cichoracearum]|uniref:Protein arginine methyltransferase NDUFAF7 n=1 Tax=Golovinomyces cichoracearum TaxID=62708 RepID=A0A420IGK4_9PEZI|nr:Protein arginine methyltransferase NDUFAF7-like protein, mitochondrial [Golovinomyces cichoracearum]